MDGLFIALILSQTPGRYQLLDQPKTAPVKTTPSSSIAWRQTYDAALLEAKSSGKRLLFDFRSKDCLWCDRLEATTLQDSRVVEALRGFVCVKVYAEENKRVIDALGISQYPTLILAKPDSTIERIDVGYVDVQTLLNRLSPVVQAMPVKASVCSPACACGCNAGGECRCRAVTATPAYQPIRTISAEWCGPRG